MLIHIRKDHIEVKAATGTPMSNKFTEELLTDLEYKGEGVLKTEYEEGYYTSMKHKVYKFKSKPQTLYGVLYTLSEKFDIELM